jgi:ElaB/YqjD/DUF883 family membrane-anchored ribosome-binding protein
VAKIIDPPERKRGGVRPLDAATIKMIDDLERVLAKAGEGVWVTDEKVYDSRAKAQGAVNLYRRTLVDDRALVAHKSKLGAAIQNGDGEKHTIALVILSDAEAAKARARGEKISKTRAAGK